MGIYIPVIWRRLFGRQRDYTTGLPGRHYGGRQDPGRLGKFLQWPSRRKRDKHQRPDRGWPEQSVSTIPLFAAMTNMKFTTVLPVICICIVDFPFAQGELGT